MISVSPGEEPADIPDELLAQIDAASVDFDRRDAEAACPHCPDGHDDPAIKPWAVNSITVGPVDGSHVAESDAEWLRELIAADKALAAEQAMEGTP